MQSIMRVLTSAAHPKVCVFLLHLGTPKDFTDATLVRYLSRIFNDTLPLPKALRPHAAALWAKARLKGVMAAHQSVPAGGWQSPALLQLALEDALTALGFNARVLLAGRYSPPYTTDALLEARAHAADAHWVALPLFPQYAFHTTQQSVAELYARLSPSERQRLQVVDAYPDHPQYLDAMAGSIDDTLNQLTPQERREAHLVFAARSIPVRAVNAGDPYPRQVEQTVGGILARLQKPPRHTLAFQPATRYEGTLWPSRSALEPSLVHTLQRLGAAGQRTVVVSPLSFVDESYDTLHGLDVAAKTAALAAGVRNYVRVPTVMARAPFVASLAALVAQQVVPTVPEMELMVTAEAQSISGAADNLSRPGAAIQTAPHA